MLFALDVEFVVVQRSSSEFEFNINSWEYEFVKSYFLADRVLLQMQMLGFETRMQNAEFRRAETWI